MRVMTALAVLQELASATDPANPSGISGMTGGWSFEKPVSEPTLDGGTKVSSALENTSMDEHFKLGAWELKLVNPNDGGDGVEIPFSLFYDSADPPTFERIELDLARFELRSDPTVLTAANLRTDPNTHLVAQRTSAGVPAPVRLHGPSFTLILSGETLDEIDARFGGASGGAAGEDFPSMRFEPPHFLVGGPESDIGVVCDEVTLDFSNTANPPVVNEFLDPEAPDGTEVGEGVWKGVHLKELGVFIGDGSKVGTWSGMAAMRDFFIDFDGILSGTFIGELVHQVVDSPQIVITIREEDGTETDDTDVALPAPTDDNEYRRVRLLAQPSWSGTTPQAGLRPRWTVPNGVHVEEPRRLTSVDLGWVRVPADGTEYTFGISITDHRLAGGAPSANRSVTVAAPTSPPAGAPFLLVVEGVPQDTGGISGTGASQRLHMGLGAGQTAIVEAISREADSATLTLTDPSLSITTGAPTQPFVSGKVQWTISASSSATVGTHGTCVVEATKGSDSVTKRLRVGLERPLEMKGPDFELISYTDWRSDIGIGLARFRGFGGVDTESIDWQLSSREVTDAVFGSAGDDALFNGASTGWNDESVDLANSGGTVRPFLHTEGRLWRLTGTIASSTITTPGPVLVGEDPGDGVMQLPTITNFAGSAADFTRADGPTIRFHYDCDRIQPTVADCDPGVGVEPLGGQRVTDRFDEYSADQVAGFIALYQALEEHLDDGIDGVGLFGFASAEGPIDYNTDLAARRAAATEVALKNPADIQAAMAAAGYAPDPSVFTDVAALTFHTASAGASKSSYDPSDYRFDRRVFAIIKPAPISASSDVVRSEYFVTLPGAPNPTLTPEVPEPQLQEHPFRHAMFRQAYVEVELLRNQLIRLQVQLKLDLEAFNENDLTPEIELNPADGITTFFLELVITDDPSTGDSDYSWELAALSDPNDKDGFAVITDSGTLAVIGPSAITVPAISALAGGGRVDVAGFLAAVGLGAVLSSTGVVDVQTLIWQGIRATILHSNSDISGFSAAFDYELEYEIDVTLPAIGRFATDEPIKLRFRNVGVEVTHDPANSPEWTAEFFYSPDDGFAIEINDPGVFRAGDGIGRLLQVRRVAAGAGSPFWTEFEFGLSFDTGIVSLDTIRVRLAFEMDDFFTGGTIEDFSFTINKIGASVDIPGALEGSGMVEIQESTVAGELNLKVVPLSLRVEAGFKFVSDPFDAFYGFLGVEFAPGIPIFNTGAALYGLHGLLGVNMGRTDDNALEWYLSNPVGVHPVEKWQADDGAWAIGVGAVVGTVYDVGFTWNTKGTFLFELPGPRFTLATLSKILEQKSSASDASISATIVSVIMFDLENNILLIALDFVFDKSPVVTFRVPAELFFDLDDPDNWHVRFGQWQPASKRITMRILDLWDVTGYLQIEGRELRNGELDLAGVAIGTGGRVDIFWGVKGVLYLSAYFEFHIGVQFDPFMLQGVVSVGGELQVGPIALGASGTLRLITPDPFVIQGEICGCISFFFFDVCGCADFEIGNGAAAIPAPKSPFKQLALIDRLNSAVLTDDDGQALASDVPIDAVVHLIFNQDMQDRRPSPATGLSAPNLRNQVSNDVYYDFHLDDLTISPPLSGIQQTWPPYSVRRSASSATIEEITDPADSNRTLRLFDWIPHSHPRALDFASGYGEVLKALIERLCEPVPDPRKGCGTFDNESYGVAAMWELEADHVGKIRLVPLQPSGLGSDVLAEASGSSRARVVPLIPVSYIGRVAEERCLELPAGAIESFVSLNKLFPTAPSEDDPNLDAGNGLTFATEWLRPLFDVGRGLIEEANSAFDLVARPEDAQADTDDVPALGDVIVAGSGGFGPPGRIPATARPIVRPDLANLLVGRSLDVGRSDVTAPASATLSGTLSSAIATAMNAMATAPRSELAARTNNGLTGLTTLSGLVYVQLPAMVNVEATFVVPDAVRNSGEVIFLDADLKPVSPVIDIGSVPPTPSTGTLRFAHHQVHTVRFGNPDPADPEPKTASWLVINPPSTAVAKPPLDRSTYLNEICGITLGEWRRRVEVEDGRNRTRFELEQLTGIVGGLPAVASAPLLEPDTLYTIDLDMSWARYESENASEEDGSGILPSAVETFATAATPPADVSRYVGFTDPVDDRQPHYYEEPTEILFLSNTVDRMFEKYGKQLVARAKSALGSHVLLQPLSTTTDRFMPLDSFEETLLDALNSLDPGCSSADWERLFPRPVLTFAEPLEPNTGYTVALIPTPLGETSWPDNLDSEFAAGRHVFRFDLTTSRWGTFSNHVDAYRAGTVGDLLAGPIARFSSLYGPLPVHTRSDRTVDDLNEALFGGPLKLADRVSVSRLWAETAAPPGPFELPTYQPIGLLLDGPEPLWKTGAGGSSLLEFDIRLLNAEGDAFSTGSPVRHKVVTGDRGTRVFALFDPPPKAGVLAVRLTYRPGPAAIEEVLQVPLGTEPGSFDEEGS